MKLFPSKKVLTRAEMPTSAGHTTPVHDHADIAYQATAHQAAGYQQTGATSKSTDNTLVVFSDAQNCYRAQKGILWFKPKKPTP